MSPNSPKLYTGSLGFDCDSKGTLIAFSNKYKRLTVTELIQLFSHI
jgi:hypothetical protein